MRIVLLAVLLVACERTHPDQPVTVAAATEFAQRFVAAAQPCDQAKLAELIDQDALSKRIAAVSSSPLAGASASSVVTGDMGARILCGWQATAESYKLLRVHVVDGHPRPVLRRLARAPRTSVVAVGYDELELEATGTTIRAVDIHSYTEGQWLSELLGETIDSMRAASDGAGSALSLAGDVRRARELQKDGKHVEALAVIDALPPKLHQARAVQMMRIKIARAISVEADRQALAELEKLFPNDPSIAMVEIDGAFMSGDYDAALRYIDAIDHAIGGDAFQDSIRAGTLAKRGHPGDLEAAAAAAERAVTVEPTLAKGWWAKLDVALAAKRWPDAIVVMDYMTQHFQAKWSDDKLRATATFAELVASPDYAAWRAKQP